MKCDIVPILKRLGVAMAGLAVIYAIVSGIHNARKRQARTAEIGTAYVPPDPLSAELRRCSGLPHSEAMEDELCRRAWVLNRQRFFGSKSSTDRSAD